MERYVLIFGDAGRYLLLNRRGKGNLVEFTLLAHWVAIGCLAAYMHFHVRRRTS